ncbi:MAG TPA: hypothetical protein PLT65_02555 [Bacilli bacterium]|nr:hypothetical protein [Bacilli bacterium]
MENEDTRLKVKNKEGQMVEIDVVDIIPAPQFNKEFIIYKFANANTDDFYASTLVESDTTFELNEIESGEEMDFINAKINELAKNMSDGVMENGEK